ncbi:hypothetical protein [Actinoallomurus iriomotensis]|uniref:Uncharacterized protein n=1 Tax=Actinoallomurus iriomotensis TaxID=478107 RepID=A0A9W6W013_9ACTN|nr:hypothetical protein [Actinoallomurus iriomotensis]GLY85899.1 hypothetical protein Airi02_038280 [Actinoallomurus iriomotensis]
MLRQTRWLTVAALLGAAVCGPAVSPAHADPAGDAQTLYCAKPENKRPLVDTAVALGLAGRGTHDKPLKVNGRDYAVKDWQQAFPLDFGRACAALVAVRKLPETSSGWTGELVKTVIGLIPVGVGALLALGSGMLTTRKASAERAAGELHAAATAYERACRDCLIAWRRGQGRSLEGAMDAPLSGLLADLQRRKSRHPRWRLERLITAIRILDRDIREADWPTEPARLRQDAQRLLDRLEARHSDVMEVVSRLDRPWRWYGPVRTEHDETPP